MKRRKRNSPSSSMMATGIAVVLALPAAAGCDGSSPSVGNSPASASPAPRQGVLETAEQQAIAAYEGMWRAYVKAGITANPGESSLGDHAAGRALAMLTDGLKSYRDKGQILKGNLVTHPRVWGASLGANPATVTVLDCMDTTEFLAYTESGQLVDDVPGGRRFVQATVSDLGADGWKVTGFGVQAIGTCE